MNTLKENIIKEIVAEDAPKKKVREGNKLFRHIGNIFSGAFLTKEQSIKQLPFILFLALLAVVYITNGNYAEKKARALNKITDDLKELRSEYITSKSDLMFISKQSEVAKAASDLNIKESVVPPKKIVIKKTSKEKD